LLLLPNAQALAGEVVELEEKVLHLRSAQLRSQAASANSGGGTAAAAAAAAEEAARRERDAAVREAQGLREEVARLRAQQAAQAESRHQPQAADSPVGSQAHHQLAAAAAPGARQPLPPPPSAYIAQVALQQQHTARRPEPSESGGSSDDDGRGAEPLAAAAEPSDPLPLEIRRLLPPALWAAPRGRPAPPAAEVAGLAPLVESIFGMADRIEAEKRQLLGDLARGAAEAEALRAANGALQARVAAMQQRLELGAAQAAAAGKGAGE
jgi:hypothetical protein